MQQIIRDIMREYERRRDLAAARREARRGEVYTAVPRIQEIDGRLMELGLVISKELLAGGDAAALTAELAMENAKLGEEKLALMAAHGFGQGFMDEVYACGLCKDTGHVGAQRCACFRQGIIEGHYRVSNLNRVLARENFEKFDMGLFSAEVDERTGLSPHGAMVKNLNIATRFVDNFVEKFANLLFYGESGLGKTFMCNCIAKTLLDAGHSVIYVTSPQLFKMVESARFDKDFDTENTVAFLDMLTRVDLLIIDDLGTEVATVVTASELFNILNTRILSRRPTIISTNYDIQEITTIYSDRITSRLLGTYTMCKFVGEDLRIKIRYKT